MLATDTFLMGFAKTMGYGELIPWLLDTATLQEAHPFHGSNWPDWVPGSGRFRQHATALTVKVKAAENKDREMAKARDQEYADTILSINLNANYIAMRAIHEKDNSLLHNVGYVIREKSKRTGHSTLRTVPLVVKVKNGPDPGSVVITFEKDPAAGSYQLQICKGEPAGEGSWGDQGIYKNCRILLSNLDRASWYYFRVRSHGNNQASPWSAPVGIIIV